jgi:hypothetical protein
MRTQQVLWGISFVVMACVVYTYSTARVRVEPFAAGKTPADILAAVKSANSEMTDTLNINTYRSQYEALIIQMEEWADLSMLNMLTQNMTTSASQVAQFNALSEFKKNLNETMTYMDNK